jgi:hypothetical protein
MKSLALVLVLLPAVLLETPARAEEALQSVRSAGKLVHDRSIDLGAELEAREPLLRAAALEAEDYASSPRRQRDDGVANRHDQLFEIFSADARLLSDIDGDGFHHAINVSFDVDVNYDDAMVYAKLYLSRDGEPWSQYFTTDLFYIHGDSVDDVYEVETELLSGYYPGYYAVLIEIYSLDHAYMVASEVLDYHSIGRDLMLEDLDLDGGYVEVHGAAGIGPLLLLLMLVQVVIAARRAPALSPLIKRQN